MAPGSVVVMIASPLGEAEARLVAEADPRVEVLYEPALLPRSRWPGDIAGDPGFRRDAAAERRWRELLGRAEVLFGIPGSSGPGLVEALGVAPRVRWVQARNTGAGEQLADAIALDPTAARRVDVVSVSGIHARPLAEFSLFGILAFAKRLPELLDDKACRRWPDVLPTMGVLHGRTLLVVGLGEIGLETARLARAFGMHVIGVRRSPQGDEPWVDEVHRPDRLAELTARADAIVVTLPLTRDTRGLVDAAALAAAKAGAVLVNVGRGAVVDEDALVGALRDGHLAGACLDVFAQEPLPRDSPLWALPNVIVCPHVAARTEDEDLQAVGVLVDNLRRHLAGEPLRNRIDPETLY